MRSLQQDDAWARYMGSPEPPALERAGLMTENTAFTVQTLMNTVASMQESINALTLRLMKQDAKDLYDIPGAPRMEKTDVQEPGAYNGSGFSEWSETFIAHLRLRDRRWDPLLKGIKERSKQPLSDMDGTALMGEANIKDNSVLQVFQQQLYEYLKKYTAGEPLTYAQAGGPEGAFEAWRRLCDQGASRRDRSMRDERRGIWHPSAVKDSALLAAIEAWEKKLAEYLRVRKEDSMSVPDKLMALEDMCSPHLQRHLSMLETQGQITAQGDKAYAEHKAALEQWFQDEKRWGKKPGLNAFAGAPPSPDEPSEQPEYPDQPEYPEGDEGAEELDPFMQQLYALVNNRFSKKGKNGGKGGKTGKNGWKTGKGGKAGKDGDVDMGTGEQQPRPPKGKGKTCYDCGEEGHYGRDCPQRKARVAAGGPVFKDNPGKDNGQWPSARDWKAMYPGPSPQQWKGWYPQKGQGKAGGSANLLQAASPLAALFQPGKMYTFSEKKDPDAPEPPPPPLPAALRQYRENQKNRYKALNLSGEFNHAAKCKGDGNCGCDDAHDEGVAVKDQAILPISIDIKDLVKKPSRNALKKAHRADRKLVVKFQDQEDYRAMEESLILNGTPLEPQHPGNAYHDRGCGSSSEQRMKSETIKCNSEFAEINLAKHARDGEWELNQRDSLAERESTTVKRPSSPTILTSISPISISRPISPECEASPECHDSRELLPKSSVPVHSESPALHHEQAGYQAEFPALPRGPRGDAAAEDERGRADAADQVRRELTERAQAAQEALEAFERREAKSAPWGKDEGIPLTTSSGAAISMRSWATVGAEQSATTSAVEQSTADRLHIAGSAKANGECSVGNPLNKEPHNGQPLSLRPQNVVGRANVESGEPSESPLKRCAPKLTPDGKDVKGLIDLVQNGQSNKSKEAFKTISNLLAGNIKGTMNTFHERRVAGSLAPLEENAGNSGGWELIRAIVDSGASVPALPPKRGRAYPLLESEGSKTGVEYQCANNECLPNLGEKLMAVMTAEGTLRGYRTQCANVGQPINAVRSMVASKSAVCFGLGPEGDQHLIINRLTGEINQIEDDGYNYLQNLWVVPPDEIEQVQRDQGPEQPFAGPGR